MFKKAMKRDDTLFFKSSYFLSTFMHWRQTRAWSIQAGQREIPGPQKHPIKNKSLVKSNNSQINCFPEPCIAEAVVVRQRHLPRYAHGELALRVYQLPVPVPP